MKVKELMDQLQVDQLQVKANAAMATAKKAQAEADQVVKELEEAQRQKKWAEQKAQYARDATEAVGDTTLPKWAVMFIQSEAHDHGHSAGQSEVDMLTTSMIHEAEDYYRKYVGKGS